MQRLKNRAKTGRFKPGQSGNPAGRPPGPQSFTAQLREVLAESADGDGGPSNLRLIVLKLVRLARSGNVRAAALIADRVDGKPGQAVSVTASPFLDARALLDAGAAELESARAGVSQLSPGFTPGGACGLP